MSFESESRPGTKVVNPKPFKELTWWKSKDVFSSHVGVHVVPGHDPKPKGGMLGTKGWRDPHFASGQQP